MDKYICNDINFDYTNIFNSNTKIIKYIKYIGPKFFGLCYKHKKVNKYIDILNSYHKMYVMDNNIFHNNNKIYLYLEFILTTDDICDKLIKILDDNQILSVLKKFLNVMPKFCIDDQYIIYTKLLSVSKIRTVIAKYDNTMIFYELIKSITDIDMYINKTDIWAKYMTKISNIINLLFIEKKNRIIFIEWGAKIINNNIEKINISPIDHNFETMTNTRSNNLFLINLIGIIYKFWITEYNISKIKEIKYSYISNIKCPIKWYSVERSQKHQLYNETTNFITQCFFLLLQGLRVVFIPLINRTNEWKILSNRFDYNENIYDDPITFIFTVAFRLKHGKVDKIIKDINKLLSNDTIINWIDDFYNALIYWIKVCDGFNGLFNIDDILRDVAVYIYYRHETIQQKQLTIEEQTHNKTITANQKYIDKYIFQFALKIIKSKKYTKNIDIRFKYFQIATQYLYAHITVYDLLNIQDKDIITTMLEYYNPITIILDEYFVYKIIHYSIVLHNDIGNINDIDSNFNYLNARYEILNLLSIIYDKYININNILVYIMSKNKYLLIHFVNIIIDNINTFSDKINALYILQSNRNDVGINIDNSDAILLLYELHIMHIMKLVKCEIIVNNMIAYELSSKIITSIISCIKNIVNIYNFSYQYVNYIGEDIQTYDFIKVVKYILKILDTLIVNNEDTLNKIVHDPNYDIDYFKKIKKFISQNKKHKNKNKYKYQIIKLIKKLKEAERITAKNKDIVYPDEFLDPLLFTLIKNPVLLPDMNKFKKNFYMDRSVIYRHLLNTKENPFNRNKLTIDELEKYNKRSDIEKENKCFKSKINTWIKDLKNKK